MFSLTATSTKTAVIIIMKKAKKLLKFCASIFLILTRFTARHFIILDIPSSRWAWHKQKRMQMKGERFQCWGISEFQEKCNPLVRWERSLSFHKIITVCSSGARTNDTEQLSHLFHFFTASQLLRLSTSNLNLNGGKETSPPRITAKGFHIITRRLKFPETSWFHARKTSKKNTKKVHFSFSCCC